MDLKNLVNLIEFDCLLCLIICTWSKLAGLKVLDFPVPIFLTSTESGEQVEPFESSDGATGSRSLS